jgi:hypothetical protein
VKKAALVDWVIGTVKKGGTKRTMGQWDNGTMGQWDNGTMGQWDKGQLENGKTGQRKLKISKIKL